MPTVSELLGQGRAAAPKPITRRRDIMKISDVEPEEVQWLWEPYIPRGMVTIITGDPGMGKGWVIYSLAAAMSQGSSISGAPLGSPLRTLFFALEDVPAIIRDRLTKQGAHLGKVHVCRELLNLTTPQGLEAFKAIVLEMDQPPLVVVDPITSFMGDSDPNKPTVVNSMISNLSSLARELGCALLLVRHRRKPGDGDRKGRDPKFGGLGSIGFQGGARSELLVGMTEDGRRALTQVKNSLGPEGKSLEFTLDGTTGKLTWIGETDIEDWELVGKMKKRSAGRPRGGAKTQEAIAFLKTFLADAPEPAQVCIAAAEEKGIGKSTLCAAKGAVVTAFRKEERWWWTLKAPEAQEGAPL